MYAVIAVLLVSMVPATVVASAHNSHKLEVSFTAPHAAIAGQPITVKAWASGGTPPYTYAWTASDGQSASEQTATFKATKEGPFTITLTVTDAAKKTATSTKTINVKSSTTLKAVLTVSANPTVGNPVSFDASTSTGTIASYAWNFGDGSKDSGPHVQHTYAQQGAYAVTLTVTDASGKTDTTSQSVTVNPASSVTITVMQSTDPQHVPVGATIPSNVNIPVNVGSQLLLQATNRTSGTPQQGTWEVTPPGGTPQRTPQQQSDYAFTASAPGQWTIAFYLPSDLSKPAWLVSFRAVTQSGRPPLLSSSVRLRRALWESMRGDAPSIFLYPRLLT